MENQEYRIMYELEASYWWFRGLHDLLTDWLRGRVGPGDKVLDAGCGTGGLMRRLAELSPQVYGFDLSGEAARFWAEGGVQSRAAIASINELPYPDNTFAAVLSADILECEGVEDARAYSELVRVARPGGLILVVVPAYQWMMTQGHHAAVHAVRRYNKRSLRALAAGLPVDVERVSHGFAALFPLIGGRRALHRLQEQFGPVAVRSELQALPPWLNESLYGLTQIERRAMRALDMPFGSSLLMLARKRGPV
jgi:SAM-dependent methyltransferase